MLKLGRSGKPHFRHFMITEDEANIIWASDKKKAADSSGEVKGYINAGCNFGCQNDWFRIISK